MQTRAPLTKEPTALSITIRPLKAEDYPATTDIYNSQNEPHHQVSNDELQKADERAQQKTNYHLLTALNGDEVVGRGQAGERAGDDEPGKFWTWFFTHEDHRGTGIDSALFDEALNLLADRNPRSLWTCIREDFVPAAAYLTERNYEEQFRSWGANIDLQHVEASELAPYRDAVMHRGIELCSYAELASDSDRDSKLAALHTELEEDAPHHEPIIPKHHPTPTSRKTLLDSYTVAVHNGRYVGIASLTNQPRFPTVPGTGLTGVTREYRNQGIGTALTAHTTAWAKAHGYTEVNAGGAGANTPMLKIIRRIGFDVEPAWITFARFL